MKRIVHNVSCSSLCDMVGVNAVLNRRLRIPGSRLLMRLKSVKDSLSFEGDGTFTFGLNSA